MSNFLKELFSERVILLEFVIKTYIFRKCRGGTVQTKIVMSIPTRLKPALEHIQNSNY